MVHVRLEEITHGEKATYFLHIDDKAHFLETARKDATFSDGHKSEFHTLRQDLAAIFKAEYSLPTPPLLAYFSDKKIEDVVENGARKNLHPVHEVDIFIKILETLAAQLTDGMCDITKIGNKPATEEEINKLREAYKHVFSYKTAA